MMRLNKKGFTLVELLAVIAILAILMLLITPNILNMFTQGRKEAFTTQVQSVWKAAEQAYISDAVSDGAPGPYCSAPTDGDGTKKLNISENESLNYYVDFDADGNVSALKVSDGTYYYDSTVEGFKLALDKVEGKDGAGTIDCETGELTVAE